MTRAHLLLIALAAAMTIQAEQVNQIIIESTTTQELSRDMVLANMVLREGGEFTRRKLSDDVKRLFATQQFDDIEVDVRAAEGDLVDLVFKIKPKPRVADIVFRGNKRVRLRRLKREVKQQIGEPLSEKLISDDLDALYKAYRDKGYHEVKIKQDIARSQESNDVTIEYTIEEALRFKVKKVLLVGNRFLSDSQLKRKMKTRRSFLGSIFPLDFFSESELEADLDTIKQMYLDRGYLDIKIDDIDRSFDRDHGKVSLTVYLTEGQTYTVSDVQIQGNTLFPSEELAQEIELKRDRIYSRRAELDDIRAISRRYNRLGHLDNRVGVDRQADPQTATVAVNYVIEEGSASTIRNINITGNRVTKDKVIRRELEIHPGDLADRTQIDLSKTRLMNLGYFESVQVVPLSTEVDDQKDLDISVAEKLTGQLMFGAGFSSADSVVGLVEVSQSNFDLRNPPSFRGGGQRFRTRAQVGSERQDYLVSFVEPWLLDRPLRLEVQAWKRQTSRNQDYTQDALGTGLTLTRRMGWKFWRQSFGYRVENIEISDIDASFTPAFTAAEAGQETVSALTFGFIRDQRDRQRFTTTGSRLSLDVEMQSESLGSYTNAYQLTLRGDQYIPLLYDSVLRFSGTVGHANNFSGDEIKIFDRFFAGGTNTIRGFDEREVGPIDSATHPEPIGGHALLLASAEVTRPVYREMVYLAAFVDSGNVWYKDLVSGTEEFDEWDLGSMSVGAGLGLRLNLPVGGLRFDYGWPISRGRDHLSSTGRLHFDFGFSF